MKARKCDVPKRAMGGKMGMDDMSMPLPPMPPMKPKKMAPKPMAPMEGGIAKPRLDRMRKTRG